MNMQDAIAAIIEQKKSGFIDLSDRVFDTPELNFSEFRSSEAHRIMLEEQGFRVETHVAGIPTALIGEWGSAAPVIAFLGEFDALPGLSQQPGIAEHRPLPGSGNGHGCGHNLLGTAALQAATAAKDYLAAKGLAGTIRYYGCPAEEGGSGKGFMVRAGVFDDVDAAITWHPAAFSGVQAAASLACVEADFHFTGRASHAAAAPHLGRSALDAVELMNVGVNYLREHMPSSARVHYALLNGGGIAPNVVQAEATVRYLVRARELKGLQELFARVKKIADGAAMMTETSVTHRIYSGDANLIGNAPLEELMLAQYRHFGVPAWSDEDHAFARDIQATLGEEEIATAYQRAGKAPHSDTPLTQTIIAAHEWNTDSLGSTDVGSVSWIVPTVQASGATYAVGTPGHSWQLTAQGKQPAAHKGMVHVAKVMAATGIALIENPAELERAKRDHQQRLDGQHYVSPIPDDAEPMLDMATKQG